MKTNRASRKNRHFIIGGILLLVLIGCTYVYFKSIMPLQNATAAYNEAVEKYNAVADVYNTKAQLASIDNIDGFATSVDTLPLIDTCVPAVAKSFLHGNTAEKTTNDVTTLSDYTEYLSQCTDVIEQITAPSEEWIIERLNGVEDIIDVQAVTEDNDPNHLLNKENGGYVACVYFTSTGIDENNELGKDPVAKGTDGGGAVEVYASLEDAMARCEYLSEFDNTILYTGSYAIVGTTVIRISYRYTDEEQYELTDRITQAFTTLD